MQDHHGQHDIARAPRAPPEMTAAILNVGDELLIGQVSNTGATWLGDELTGHGLDVVCMLTVGDVEDQIAWAFEQLLAISDVLVCTGGLGATHDDVTRQAIATVLGRPLERRADVLEHLRQFYRARGRELSAVARAMADVPAGFSALENPVGAAPGLWIDGIVEPYGRRAIAVVPGVPHEMRAILRQSVLPRLTNPASGGVLVHRTLRTAGIGETAIAEKLGTNGVLPLANVRLAFLPDFGEVRLRLSARAPTADEAHRLLDAAEAEVREHLGERVYGAGTESLAATAGRMLRDRGLTLALAESCTGGAVASAITDVPGSSVYFVGGAVAYSNASKVDILGVDPEVLTAHGAVSERVAVQMATGVRSIMRASIGVGVTGVAGPGGGSRETPVGTVWLGYADDDGAEAVRLNLSGDRITIKLLTVSATLDLVRRQIRIRDQETGRTTPA